MDAQDQDKQEHNDDVSKETRTGSPFIHNDDFLNKILKDLEKPSEQQVNTPADLENARGNHLAKSYIPLILPCSQDFRYLLNKYSLPKESQTYI